MKTNEKPLDYQSLNFATLLDEGLRYVEGVTPTKLDCQEGNITFAKLLSDKLEEMCIPHKVFNILMCSNKNHKHICILIDNNLYVNYEGIMNSHIMGENKIQLSKDELNNLFAKVDYENSIFDKDCISFIKTKLDEIFLLIGDYKLDSLEIPEKVEYTKNTQKALKNVFMKEMKKQKEKFDIFKQMMDKD